MSLTTLRRITIATALLATITSTLSVYPHQLAYFNKLAGGPENGHRHLLGSNVDWGQDLLLVRSGLAQMEEGSFRFSHAGLYDPHAVGIHCAKDNGGANTSRSLIATLSALHNDSLFMYDCGTGELNAELREHLRHREPDFRIGYSVFGFRVAGAELGEEVPDKLASNDLLHRDQETAAARDKPLKVPPLVEPFFNLSPADYAWVSQQIQPCEESDISPSYCLHVLRAHGMEAKFDHPTFPSSEALLAPLLDVELAQEVFGESALVQVSAGARYRTRKPPRQPRWREFHRDQNLASFAELGLPLSTLLSIEGESVFLRGVLNDSIANFHLKQAELEWTGLAYALYLPPQAAWVNRYGEEYSFDDLALELLHRPMVNASCGGSHLLFSLTMILRANEQEPVLSDSVRLRIWDRLELCLRLAVDAQHPDGWWPGDWFYESELGRGYGGQSPPATSEQRLIVTGHLAEWMLYLPEDFQVPVDSLKRASFWLLAHLKGLTKEQKMDQTCPCTHAVCVLRQLSSPCGDPGD